MINRGVGKAGPRVHLHVQIVCLRVLVSLPVPFNGSSVALTIVPLLVSQNQACFNIAGVFMSKSVCPPVSPYSSIASLLQSVV